MTTGICTLSFFVPGLMRISMPETSVFGVISMFAVDCRPSASELERILYAPSGTLCRSATSRSRRF